MKLQREIRRKVFHILAGMSIPVIYYVFMVLDQAWVATWILLAATLCILAVDVIRLRHQFVKIIFIDFFGPMMRRHEISALTGATYLMISSLVCILVFTDSVAIAAISYLVIGDSLAAVVGRSLGRTKFFEKSFEGAGAGLAGCLAVGALIVGLPHTDLGWLQMAAGALTAIVVEMLPIPLDDNIRIPLASGAVMHLLF
jgi:dolichol kinase